MCMLWKKPLKCLHILDCYDDEKISRYDGYYDKIQFNIDPNVNRSTRPSSITTKYPQFSTYAGTPLVKKKGRKR